MTRQTGRTAACGQAQADVRLKQAESFAYVARTVHQEPDSDAMPLRGVATALAVLAGIAAADAMCCARVGRVYRGQDHDAAVALVRKVVPEGEAIAEDLRRLLDQKDQSQYQWVFVSQESARASLRQMQKIIAAAQKVVR